MLTVPGEQRTERVFTCTPPSRCCVPACAPWGDCAPPAKSREKPEGRAPSSPRCSLAPEGAPRCGSTFSLPPISAEWLGGPVTPQLPVRARGTHQGRAGKPRGEWGRPVSESTKCFSACGFIGLGEGSYSACTVTALSFTPRPCPPLCWAPGAASKGLRSIRAPAQNSGESSKSQPVSSRSQTPL